MRGPTRFSGACSASIRPHLIKSRFFNPPPPPAIKPELRGNENSFVAAVHHSPRAGLHVARAGSAGRRSRSWGSGGAQATLRGKILQGIVTREKPLLQGTPPCYWHRRSGKRLRGVITGNCGRCCKGATQGDQSLDTRAVAAPGKALPRNSHFLMKPLLGLLLGNQGRGTKSGH